MNVVSKETKTHAARRRSALGVRRFARPCQGVPRGLRKMRVEVVVAGRDPPLSIELCETSKPTAADVRSAIYSRTHLNPRKHHLRLIVDGHLLANDIPLSLGYISDSGPAAERCRVLTGSVIHCGVSEYPSTEPRPKKTDANGEHIPEGSMPFVPETVAVQPMTTSLSSDSTTNFDFQMRGCSREGTGHGLVETAIPQQSVSETALMEVVATSSSNTSFSSSNITSPSYVLQAPPTEFGQESGPSLEDQDEMVGDLTDFCSGCMLGCGLGLIMLLLTFDKTIVFSKKFQDGVRIGVFFNFAFGVLLLVSEGDHASLF